MKAIACVTILPVMPIIQSAIKKVRKDKTRAARNKKREGMVDKLLRAARKSPSVENLKNVYSALDKAAKVNLIHKNRAARLKSRLSKLVTAK